MSNKTPMTSSEKSTRWRKKHREAYNEYRKIAYLNNIEKEIARKCKSYYWKKECLRLRNILIEV